MKQKIFIIGLITGVLGFIGCDSAQNSDATKNDSTKIQSITPKEILFTSPTVEKSLPDFEDKSDTTNLQFSEDDWRQIEFISKNQKSSIDMEIAKIKDIYDNFSHNTDTYVDFKKVALRDIIKQPLTINFSRLKLYLAVNNTNITGLSFYNNFGEVKNGFSFIVNGINYYGVVDHNTVKTFCIHSVDKKENLSSSIENLSKLLKDENLYLVDWRQMKVMDENSIGMGL